MKLNLRRALPLLMVVALTYSACKKTENKTATGPSTDEVAATIGKNLSESLSGAYGGASIKDGVAANAALTASNPKLKIQGEAGCGFFTDNSLNIDYNDGTIKSTTTGSVSYQFICDDITLKTLGYHVITQVTTDGKTIGNAPPKYTFNFSVNQDYQVRGLNPNNSKFSLNGTLTSIVTYDYTKPAVTHSTVKSTYTFTDLKIDGDDNYDITDGSATLRSQGTTSQATTPPTGSSWDYTVTIKFQGNHKAKLTFLAKNYSVDLLTGIVTPL